MDLCRDRVDHFCGDDVAGAGDLLVCVSEESGRECDVRCGFDEGCRSPTEDVCVELLHLDPFILQCVLVVVDERAEQPFEVATGR